MLEDLQVHGVGGRADREAVDSSLRPKRRERFAHRRRDRQTRASPVSRLRCVVGARDVLNNARTNFNELFSDGGEVRLVARLLDCILRPAPFQIPISSLVLGAVTNAPLGRFTRIAPTS